MASEVYTVEEVSLQDGTTADIRPLPIAKMRKFMRVWSDHMANISAKIAENTKFVQDHDDDETEAVLPNSDADLTDAQYDTYIKLCVFGLAGQLQDAKTDKQFRDYLEDNLDEPTIYKILDVTGGLKLGQAANDPNLNPAGM